MKKTISILGCGWLGKALAIDLVRKNYSIKGSTTSPNKIDGLKSIGIEPSLIDLNSKQINLTDFLESDILIIAITLKNSQAFSLLIDSISKSKVKEVIFISSTSVYPLNNSVITEDTPTLSTPLAEIENLFQVNNTFNTTILRFGGLYGYDRAPGNFFKTNKPIKNPEGFINFIHQDDCIAIINQLINQGIGQEALNACSPSHPSRRAFYTQEFEKVGRPTPLFDEDSTNDYKIINSDKMISTLNYTFKYENLLKVK